MNLLDKKKSFGALVLGLLLFVSCEKNGPFGLSSEDVAPVEFSSIEIPVTSSVVWLDSVQSSDLSTMLVGSFQSSTFGNIEATGYTKLHLNRDLITLVPSESILDSVRLNLDFNYVFDSSAMAANWGYNVFSVNRGITDTLHITTDEARVSDSLWATSDLEILDFDSTYSTEFNEVWGQVLFDLMKDEDERVEDQEAFESFFRGIAFKAKPGAGENIFGVQVGEPTSVTLYYREPGIGGNIDVQNEHNLVMNTVTRFYNLTVDRSATPLSFLEETNVEYTPADDKRYVQSGAGIVTKIDISQFRDLITEDPRLINLAELSIGPIDELEEETPPPNILFLALTDDRNTLIRDRNTYRFVQSDGNNPIGSSAPAQLVYNSETRTYSGSITSFLQTYFSGRFQRDEFFLFPSNMNTGVNGFAFDAEDVKLKIIFSELQ